MNKYENVMVNVMIKMHFSLPITYWTIYEASNLKLKTKMVKTKIENFSYENAI